MDAEDHHPLVLNQTTAGSNSYLFSPNHDDAIALRDKLPWLKRLKLYRIIQHLEDFGNLLTTVTGPCIGHLLWPCPFFNAKRNKSVLFELVPIFSISLSRVIRKIC